MFDSITIHYIPKQHSIGKLAECLLFYDEVNIILRPNSLAHLLQNIRKLAHIRMDFAGIMQTIGIKGRYVGFTYIRPLYGFAPFWRS